MIITAPTGLYKSVLPQGTESGNITYTISSQDPPRTNVRAIQLPVAEEIRLSPEKIFDDSERRAQFGELIFTIANSRRSDPGSNRKLFEVGEILAFEENPPEEELQTALSPEIVDIRHDTNLLDLNSVGLSDEEIDILISQSEIKLAELEKEFLSVNTQIKDFETEISENQKAINETNKTIKAVREIFDIPEGDIFFDNAVYQKLLVNLAALEVEREELISGHNGAVIEAATVYRSIIRVSELVR